MKEIFLVEDDENIRGVVKYGLESAAFVVKEFESSHEFWRSLQKGMPDLCILDIMLPDESGIEILQELRYNKTTKEIPVILLTARDGEYDKVKGLELGADDYITKPFSVLELISRIKAICRRLPEAKPDDVNDKISIDSVVLYTGRRTVFVGEQKINLTYKEFELLKFLMENKGLVLSRDRIMDAVWGVEFRGESRTVDVHIKTVRDKLGLDYNFIRTIRRVGYKVGE